MLVYGHYDVQSPGADELWTSPPFEPQVRDGFVYARGVSDDKGNLHALLRAALDLAAAGELPVNVRVLADGEEEIGGHSVIDHLATVEEQLAAAVIFDAHMVGPRRPAITLGLRGLCGFQLRLRHGGREVHSGLYGGAAANPVHDLVRVLAAVVGAEADFAAGARPPSDAERGDWRALPPGEEALREAGAAPLDERAGGEFYERVWTRPALNVHSVGAGDPALVKTSIPTEARASLSLRLAPGQSAAAIGEEIEARLHAACPPGAELELDPWPRNEPAFVDPRDPVIAAASAAIETATGVRPLFVRSGGSIPIAAALLERGTPTVLSGFGSADDNIHSPDERLPLEHYAWALASARALFPALAEAIGSR